MSMSAIYDHKVITNNHLQYISNATTVWHTVCHLQDDVACRNQYTAGVSLPPVGESDCQEERPGIVAPSGDALLCLSCPQHCRSTYHLRRWNKWGSRQSGAGPGSFCYG